MTYEEFTFNLLSDPRLIIEDDLLSCYGVSCNDCPLLSIDKGCEGMKDNIEPYIPRLREGYPELFV
jgi:hypothetical protein